jgi:rRNA maturation RNase YbeY
LFLTELASSEKTQLDRLDIIFCSDDYLLNINKSFLNHDYFTDIITFDLTPPKTSAIIGEIYISVDRIISNAQDFNTSIKEECHRVIFHGLLHLCGYKDKKKEEKSRMTKKENEYLSKYFY